MRTCKERKVIQNELEMAMSDMGNKFGKPFAHSVEMYAKFVQFHNINSQQIEALVSSNCDNKNQNVEAVKPYVWRYLVAKRFLDNGIRMVDSWIFNDYLDLMRNI